jgi:hypothetical protein
MRDARVGSALLASFLLAFACGVRAGLGPKMQWPTSAGRPGNS